jgi:hypothetical protein
LRLVGLVEIDERLVWSSTTAPSVALYRLDAIERAGLGLVAFAAGNDLAVGATEDGANHCRVEK